MNSLSSKPRGVTVRLRALLPIIFLLTACAPELAGREARPQRSADSPASAHFAAARQAQIRQDYATAEREYRAVLAISPDFAEVHMNLGKIRRYGKHSPVLALCCSVILTNLSLPGSGKVGASRRIGGALGSGFSASQLWRTCRQQEDDREQGPQADGDSTRLTRQAVHASAFLPQGQL